MKVKPVTQKNFLRGLVAVSGIQAQSKGSVPRMSNLLLSKRGSLVTCDGTKPLSLFGGSLSARGRFLAATEFSPVSVPPYNVALVSALDQFLGAPANLVATLVAGSLTGTFFYKVTAIDGVGGETTASAEVTASPVAQGVKLTWNPVPNAYGYNVYRSTVTNTEVLYIAGVTPSAPATSGYVDTGVAPFPPASPPFAIANVTVLSTTAANGIAKVILNTQSTAYFYLGQAISISGNSDAKLNVGSSDSVTLAIQDAFTVLIQSAELNSASVTVGELGTGGNLNAPATIPTTDNTQQVALIKFPSQQVSYNNSNIEALFPAAPYRLGTTPAGNVNKTTTSGGVPGLTSMLPLMKPFTNRLILALGNGFSPQAYWDRTGTPTNPANNLTITAVAKAADEITVTVSDTLQATDPTKLAFLPLGSNVLFNMTDATYNGVFPVISVNPGAKQFVVRNPSASGGASTGSATITTTPIATGTALPLGSTFIPAYPAWTTATAYSAGEVIVPTTQPSPNIYLTCLQGGTTGAAEPTWPAGFVPGQDIQIKDNNIIWKVAGLLQSAAPAPVGAAHIEIFSNALWMFNTSFQNSSNGLDGPTSMRMSSIGNPFSHNPINQDFIDKDDGAQGASLSSFTITAQGIPPQGSLVAFKDFATYQITGVFGASNFAIQRVKTSMGILAPRSVQFVPGFGLIRFTHLGFGLFDGVEDRVVSEEIRPYIFGSNLKDDTDITILDSQFQGIMWGFQTSQPPMYCAAIPIASTPGASTGQLTRIVCYDTVLRAWAGTVDLVSAISTASQLFSSGSGPLTVLGGYSDGSLSEWQANDIQWGTAPGSNLVTQITSTGTGPQSFTLPVPVKVQDYIYYILMQESTSNLTVPSDQLGNNYNNTNIWTDSVNYRVVYGHSQVTVAGTPTITVNFPNGVVASIVVGVFRGIPLTNFDREARTDGGITPTSASSKTATFSGSTTNMNDILLSVAFARGLGLVNKDPGAATVATVTDSNGRMLGMAFRIVQSFGTYSTTWQQTNNVPMAVDLTALFINPVIVSGVINWSVRTPTVASNDSNQVLFVNKLFVRGINANSAAGLTVTPRIDGVARPSYTTPVIPTGDFQAEVGIFEDVRRAEALVAGSGDVEIQGFEWEVVAKPVSVPLVIA